MGWGVGPTFRPGVQGGCQWGKADLAKVTLGAEGSEIRVKQPWMAEPATADGHWPVPHARGESPPVPRRAPPTRSGAAAFKLTMGATRLPF